MDYKEYSFYEPEPPAYNESKLGVLLIGSSQAGKSTLGNALIQTGTGIRDNAFKTGGLNQSETKEVQNKQFLYDGYIIDIIDTPGLEDTSVSDKSIIEKLLGLIATGIKITTIILVVNKAFKINDQLKQMLELYLNFFSGITERFFVVVSNMVQDVVLELQNDKGMTVQDYVSHISNRLKPIFNVGLKTFAVNSKPRLDYEFGWLKSLLNEVVGMNSRVDYKPFDREEYIKPPMFWLASIEVEIKKLQKAVDRIKKVEQNGANFKGKVVVVEVKNDEILYCIHPTPDVTLRVFEDNRGVRRLINERTIQDGSLELVVNEVKDNSLVEEFLKFNSKRLDKLNKMISSLESGTIKLRLLHDVLFGTLIDRILMDLNLI